MKRYLIGFIGAVGAFGCAVDNGEESDPGAAASNGETEVAANSQSSELLAEIVIEGDHRIQFIETMPGSVTVAETGFRDPDGSLVEKLHSADLRTIYDALAPQLDAATQARLDSAQLRVDALNREAERLEAAGEGPPVELPSQAVAGPRPKGDVASTQQAITSNINDDVRGYRNSVIFRSAWCDSAGWDYVFCATNTGSADSGFLGDLKFIRTVVVNNSSTGNAQALHRQFVCITNIPIIGCVERAWRTQNTFSIGVGKYGYFTDTFKWTRFIGNPASNSTIHIAVGWDL